MDRETTRRGEPELIDRLDFEAMDQPHELLAEAAGITLAQAEAALEWMRGQTTQQHDHDTGDAILRALNLIVVSSNPFVCGLRAMAMKWLIRDEGEPIAVIAERCGISRQLLHFHVRSVEKQTGIHNQAQKRASLRPMYAMNAKERWSLLDAAQRRARRNSQRYRAELAALAEAGIDPEAAGISATHDENLTTPEA
jgi:DNA-binding CsgD family transcriptional regulator